MSFRIIERSVIRHQLRRKNTHSVGGETRKCFFKTVGCQIRPLQYLQLCVKCKNRVNRSLTFFKQIELLVCLRNDHQQVEVGNLDLHLLHLVEALHQMTMGRVMTALAPALDQGRRQVAHPHPHQVGRVDPALPQTQGRKDLQPNLVGNSLTTSEPREPNTEVDQNLLVVLQVPPQMTKNQGIYNSIWSISNCTHQKFSLITSTRILQNFEKIFLDERLMCLLVGKAPVVELGEVEALRLPQRKINRNQSLAQKSPPNLQVINQATRPQVKQKEGLVKTIGVITDGKMTKIKMLLAKRLLPQRRHRKNQRLPKPSQDQRFRCEYVMLINVAYHGKTI